MQIKIIRANEFMSTEEYIKYISYFRSMGWHRVFSRNTTDKETTYALLEKED